MKKPFQFSFDGFGINVVSEEFSPRLATFQSNFRGQEHNADLRKIGRLFEAAPDLLAALENLEAGVRLWMSRGVSEADMKQAQAAIAKAKGIAS